MILGGNAIVQKLNKNDGEFRCNYCGATFTKDYKDLDITEHDGEVIVVCPNCSSVMTTTSNPVELETQKFVRRGNWYYRKDYLDAFFQGKASIGDFLNHVFFRPVKEAPIDWDYIGKETVKIPLLQSPEMGALTGGNHLLLNDKKMKKLSKKEKEELTVKSGKFGLVPYVETEVEVYERLLGDVRNRNELFKRVNKELKGKSKKVK